jgi:hypothetical protein
MNGLLRAWSPMLLWPFDHVLLPQNVKVLNQLTAKVVMLA